jgi:hypothetical protein
MRRAGGVRFICLRILAGRSGRQLAILVGRIAAVTWRVRKMVGVSFRFRVLIGVCRPYHAVAGSRL